MELEPISLGNPLPVAANPPVVSATLGDRLHVFARDHLAGRVRHCAVDAMGEPAAEARDLPLISVAGATACDGSLIVTGAGAARGPVAAELGADGATRWSADVPPDGELETWPIPVCLATSTRLIWSSIPATLRVADLNARQVKPAAHLAMGGSVEGMDATGSNRHVVVVLAGDDGLRVLAMDGAAPPMSISNERAVAPGICQLSDGLLVAWIAPSAKAIRVQRLAARTLAHGQEHAIVAASRGETLRALKLLGAWRDHVALTWTVSTGARPGDVTVEQFVAVYDTSTGLISRVALGAGSAFFAGGWVNDSLVVIHGEQAPLASAFRLRL